MEAPLRILVVEDEMVIALMIEDMLNELGQEVVGPAMRLSPALDIARKGDIDFAMLDINLNGELSFPVAVVLRNRGIPFVFVSGYGKSGLDPSFANYPVVKKPFDLATLKASLPLSTRNPALST